MLFHTQLFLLVFLPLVLGGYYLSARHRWARQWLLIIASMVFYGYWDPRLVPLLAGSITVNWLLARACGRHRVARRWPVWAGIALNLVVLGIFKYADFFAASIAALGGRVHDPWNIVLPLGISFFTFQQISYLADLGRGHDQAGYSTRLHGFADYALFVSFFPQLVAGPIVRHNELIGQFALSPLREGLYQRLNMGLVLLILGVFKKTILADGMATIADPLYAAAAAATALNFAKAWTAAGAFGLQIYFDFSGYSDMAIGLALMFGFSLPINFNAPYRACSIRDFWRRWHMTLSRFLRDYLYIPLGGNRHGLARQLVAVMVTMLLGGLWHGAGWTFVAWGGLHGLGLAVNQLWDRVGRPLPRPLAWLLAMLVVFVGWVLFRAESFAAAAAILSSMVGGSGWSLTLSGLPNLWMIPVAAMVAIVGPTSQRIALELMTPWRWHTVGVAVALILALLQVGGGLSRDFVYFQF